MNLQDPNFQFFGALQYAVLPQTPLHDSFLPLSVEADKLKRSHHVVLASHLHQWLLCPTALCCQAYRIVYLSFYGRLLGTLGSGVSLVDSRYAEAPISSYVL